MAPKQGEVIQMKKFLPDSHSQFETNIADNPNYNSYNIGKENKKGNSETYEVSNLDNNWLEKYIEQLDKDNKDFKAEMRERDQRTEERQKELENRLRKEREEAEARTKETIKEFKAIADRIESKMDSYEKDLKNHFWANVALVITVFLGFVSIIVALMQIIASLN